MARYPVIELNVATSFQWRQWRHFQKTPHAFKWVDASQIVDGPPLSESSSWAVFASRVPRAGHSCDVFLTGLQSTAIIAFLCADIRATGQRVGLREVSGILTPSTEPYDNFDCPRTLGDLRLWLSTRLDRFVTWARPQFRMINGGTSVNVQASISHTALKGVSLAMEEAVPLMAGRLRWPFQTCVGILNAMLVACFVAPLVVVERGRTTRRATDPNQFWGLGTHASAAGVDVGRDAGSHSSLSWAPAADHDATLVASTTHRLFADIPDAPHIESPAANVAAASTGAAPPRRGVDEEFRRRDARQATDDDGDVPAANMAH